MGFGICCQYWTILVRVVDKSASHKSVGCSGCGAIHGSQRSRDTFVRKLKALLGDNLMKVGKLLKVFGEWVSYIRFVKWVTKREILSEIVRLNSIHVAAVLVVEWLAVNHNLKTFSKRPCHSKISSVSAHSEKECRRKMFWKAALTVLNEQSLGQNNL